MQIEIGKAILLEASTEMIARAVYHNLEDDRQVLANIAVEEGLWDSPYYDLLVDRTQGDIGFNEIIAGVLDQKANGAFAPGGIRPFCSPRLLGEYLRWERAGRDSDGFNLLPPATSMPETAYREWQYAVGGAVAESLLSGERDREVLQQQVAAVTRDLEEAFVTECIESGFERADACSLVLWMRASLPGSVIAD